MTSLDDKQLVFATGKVSRTIARSEIRAIRREPMRVRFVEDLLPAPEPSGDRPRYRLGSQRLNFSRSEWPQRSIVDLASGNGNCGGGHNAGQRGSGEPTEDE